MFVQKEAILQKRSLNPSLDREAVSNRPLKEKSSNNSGYESIITSSAFDNMLARIFATYKDESDSSYLKNRWLATFFEDALVAKSNLGFYHSFYALVRDFHNRHPFRLEPLLRDTIRTFLLEYPNLWALIKNKELDFSDGPEATMTTYFIPRFTKFVTSALTNNKSYKSVRQIVSQLLARNIEKKLQAFEPGFVITNYPNLQRLANDFNYDLAKQLNLAWCYDNFFKIKTSRELLNLNQAEFEMNFDSGFEKSLKAGTKLQLRGLVYHRLFADFLELKKIVPVQKQFLSNAKSLVKSGTANYSQGPLQNQFLNDLEHFFPGITPLLRKFGFSYATSETGTGILFQKAPGYEYLTAIDSLKQNYDFRFQLKYSFPLLNKIGEANDYNFQILVQDVLSPFEQATNVVEAFKPRITWNLGYRDSLGWTEKEIVSWIDDFTSISDLLGFVNAIGNNHSAQKVLTFAEWSRFSGSNLHHLNFDAIDSSFQFQVVPVIEFTKPNPRLHNNNQEFQAWINNANANPSDQFIHMSSFQSWSNLLGSTRVFLRLEQSQQKSTGETQLVRQHDFLVKDASKTVSMLELILQTIQEHYVSYHNWTGHWTNRKRMWLNEFLNVYLPGKRRFIPTFIDDFSKRSDMPNLHNHVSEIIKDLNQNYRNDFRISPKLKPNYRMTNFQTNVLSYGFEVNDEQMENGFLKYANNIAVGALSAFADVKKTKDHPWQVEKEAEDAKLIKEFHDAYLVSPSYGQFSSGMKIEETAVFQVGYDQMTFGEIIGFLRRWYGPQNVWYSTVFDRYFYDVDITGPDFVEKISAALQSGQKSFLHKAISIHYEIKYFDFASRTPKTRKKRLFLTLFDERRKLFVSYRQMEKDHNRIMNSLSARQLRNQKLMMAIEKLFSRLRENNHWKNNVEFPNYTTIINEIEKLVKTSTRKNMMLRMKEIFDGQIPKAITEQMQDSNYVKVFREILINSETFSKVSLQKILRNQRFLDLLKNQKQNTISQWISRYSDVSQATRYWYFGSGVAFALIGMLAGLTSLKQIRMGKKVKRTQLQFKKSRVIALLSLVVSMITLAASSVLIFLFFVEKGGF